MGDELQKKKIEHLFCNAKCGILQSVERIERTDYMDKMDHNAHSVYSVSYTHLTLPTTSRV